MPLRSIHRSWSCPLTSILLAASCAAFAQSSSSATQQSQQPASAAAQAAPPAAEKPQSSVTDHVLHIHGEAIPYRAVAGTLILKDQNGQPEAHLFYVAYTRTDVKDTSRRPICFLFNGGPGSSAVWMHMGRSVPGE